MATIKERLGQARTQESKDAIIAERDAIIAQFKALPKFVADRLATHPVVKRIGFDDAMQLAWIGLMISAERYDPERLTQGRPAKFITYATCAMLRYVVSHGKRVCTTIRVPVYVWDNQGKPGAMALARRAICCSQFADEGDWDQPSLPPIPWDQDAEQGEQAIWLQESLTRLPPAWTSLLRERMAGRKLQEIADERGISKERVRQIQAKAIDRLREFAGERKAAC